MKYIPHHVTSAIGRAGLRLSKNSPRILFVAGLASGVAATVTACRATLRVEDVLDETKQLLEATNRTDLKDYTEEDRARDRYLLYVRGTVQLARLYGPSLILGTASIVCLTRSHQILTNRLNAVSAAYAALHKAFEEYRKRVVDEVGVDRERELRYPNAKKAMDEEVYSVLEATNNADGFAVWFDEKAPDFKRIRAFNEIFINGVQQHSRDLLWSRGHVFLNDVYDALGLPRTPAGSVVGWVKVPGQDPHIDFGLWKDGELRHRDFMSKPDGAILLDFNVDGIIFDRI